MIRVIIAVGLIIAWLFLALEFAFAHDWYPVECCNGNNTGGDCHPVECDSLVEDRTGIEWNGIHFRQDQIHPSQDKNCHVCVGNDKGYGHAERKYPYCVFVRPTS